MVLFPKVYAIRHNYRQVLLSLSTTEEDALENSLFGLPVDQRNWHCLTDGALESIWRKSLKFTVLERALGT